MSNKKTANAGTPGSKPAKTLPYTFESSDADVFENTFELRKGLYAFFLQSSNTQPTFDTKEIVPKVGMRGPMPSSEFISNGVYQVPINFLKRIFKDLSPKFPEIARFATGFQRNDRGFYDLTRGNSNYPSINSSFPTTGGVKLTFTFTDAKGCNMHIIAMLRQAGDLFNIFNIELWALVNGDYTAFAINIDSTIFNFSALLTKEQVLNLCFSFLGELMVLKFADFFVGMKGEAPYDKQALLKLYLRRISRRYTFKFDKVARTITIGLRARCRIGYKEYHEQCREQCRHIIQALKLAK